MNKRILIIAGEASGDAHGAGVVRELKRRNPKIEVFGIGGDKMQQEGMKLVYHVRELSFMGFVEVLQHLPLIRSVERTLSQLMRLKKPDLVLLIDYPGFNLRFARMVKQHGVKVFYYISPQVWAWKRGRLKKMRRLIDKMFVVFPFELPIYAAEGIPAEFVGHPLLEEMKVSLSREHFYKRFSIDPGRKFIAIIPGSRQQEIKDLFSTMVRAADTIRRSHGLEIVVAVAPNLSVDMMQSLLPPSIEVKFVQHSTYETMQYASLAVVTSGTATLETACFETPMIVVYRTSWITYLVARLVVKIKNIGLVNIVAGKTIVPELIQQNATVPMLVRRIRELLDDGSMYREMKKELSGVKANLGTVGASRKVAEAILAAI